MNMIITCNWNPFPLPPPPSLLPCPFPLPPHSLSKAAFNVSGPPVFYPSQTPAYWDYLCWSYPGTNICMKVIQCCNFHKDQQMAALLAFVAHERLEEIGNQHAGGWVSVGQNAVQVCVGGAPFLYLPPVTL